MRQDTQRHLSQLISHAAAEAKSLIVQKQTLSVLLHVKSEAKTSAPLPSGFLWAQRPPDEVSVFLIIEFLNSGVECEIHRSINEGN